MRPAPQFKARLEFHFRELTAPHQRRWFVFGEDLHRRVPMLMDGVDNLNTVGMWAEAAATVQAGDSAVVDCVVIVSELYAPVVQPGVRFELWDGGFFATGTVLERFDEAWPQDAV